MYLSTSTSTEDFPQKYLSTFQVLYKLYLSTDVLKYKVLLPGSGIEGVSGGEQIAEFWRTHFSQLKNCVSNSSVHACEYGCDTLMRNLLFLLKRLHMQLRSLI